MKKILFSLLMPMIICACNNNTQSIKAIDSTGVTGSTVHSNATDTIVTTAQPFAVSGCYEMIIKKDTAFLNLTVKDTTVTGTLVYKWFEKDNNNGTIKGVLRNNIIDADYTFQSEGMTSVREVVFKIQDTTILQATGHVTEQNNKAVFTDKSALKYNNIYPFVKVQCP